LAKEFLDQSILSLSSAEMSLGPKKVKSHYIGTLYFFFRVSVWVLKIRNYTPILKIGNLPMEQAPRKSNG
jgi:hypothetical protein